MSRILIIEDEPSIVMVLSEFLSDEGYTIDKAYDGMSGMNKFKEKELPDLVVVDLNMPVVSGRKVIEIMRSDEKLKSIPVIIMTGNVFNAVDFPDEKDYQDVLEKPFDLSILLQKIHKILDKD